MRGTTAAAVCALALVAAPGASAAPRPCITDAAGDVDSALAPTGDPTADLLSVDVSSARGRLTSTIRLAALDAAPPVLGHRYDVYLRDGERTMSLTAHVDSGLGSYALAEVTGNPHDGPFTSAGRGAITGRMDATTRSIVMTVELQRLGFGVGRRVTVTARSWQAVGTMNSAPEQGRASAYGQMDDTDHAASHRIGTSGCKR